MERLAERLRAMEELNKSLIEELAKSRREHDQQMKQILQRVEDLAARPGNRQEETVPSGGGVRPIAPAVIGAAAPGPGDSVPDYTEGQFGPFSTRPGGDVEATAPAVGGAAAPGRGDPVPDYTEGQFGPFSPPPGYGPSEASPSGSGRSPLRGSFGPGFRFQTEDEEYRLQIHYESQIDVREWEQRGQVPADSGFYLPRQRIFFDGRITKPIEYEFSINRGLGGINLLNAYINIHLDDRFEFKMGRFFTPFTYDQYAISNYWLPTPERSLFTTNLGLNRQFGMMGWGYLFEKRLDYAAGVFNGSRNSFEPVSNSPDYVGYFNARPFQETELEALGFLKFLNFGTSVAFGRQDQSAVPMAFRLAAASPNSDTPGPGVVPFLMLNQNVIERGDRLLGSVHSAYYFRGLSLIGEWQYGHQSYAADARSNPVRVPVSGFYIAGSYLLTGEHVERRTRIVPLRPFIPSRKGERWGPGAWELVGRVSEVGLGRQVFTAGFADPNLWSNRAITTELGVNWYWNEYTKIYMFWLHGDFADPVAYRPGGLQSSADMFWMRFQLYF